MKKIILSVLVIVFFSNTLILPPVFAAERTPTSELLSQALSTVQIDKTKYLNTIEAIKDARASVKNGKYLEALAVYVVAGAIVNVETEPILKRKILDETAEVQKWVIADLEHQETKRLQDLQTQKTEKIRALYVKANDAFGKNSFDEAQISLTEILTLDPAQKEAKNYIEKIIPQRIAALKAQHQKDLELAQEKKIATLYDQAYAFYREDSLADAEKTFQEILAIDLDQEQAEKYVKVRIPEAIALKAKRDQIRLAEEKAKVAR